MVERDVEQRRCAASSHDASPVSWYSVSRPVASAAWSSRIAALSPTTTAQAGPAQPAVDDCRSTIARAHRVAASRNSGRSSATPASASAVIASPFHAVTTLSSRPGCGRVRRAASSAARTRSNRSASSGSSSSCSTELPCSKVPSSVTSKSSAAQRPSSSPRDLAQLRGRPHVGQPLATVGVGVQRRREHPAGAQVVDHEPRGLLGHPARQRVSTCDGPSARTPAAAAHCRRASSRSAAPPTTRRRCSGRNRRPAGRRCRRAPSPCRSAPPPPAAARRRCVRGCAAAPPAAPTAGTSVRRRNPPRSMSSSLQHGGDGVVAQRGLHRRPTAGQARRHRPQLAGDRSEASSTSPRRVRQVSATAASSCRKFGFRVVGAAEERPPVGSEEARHRPAALTGQRDGGVHVDRVEVGPLLAVDLDVHEAVVHRGGDLIVLERLVGHHVAPVARRVPDRQQDRHVTRSRLGQRLGRPLLPVHRVVGVLAQVGAGRLGQGVRRRAQLGVTLLSVAAGPSSAAWSGSGARVERLGQLAQMPVHRPHQQERADQQQHDDRADRTGWPCRSPGRCRGALLGQQADRRSSATSFTRRSRSPRTGRSRATTPASATGPARIPRSAIAAAAIRSGARKKSPVGVDLRRVRPQRVVTLREVLGALDAGGHPLLKTSCSGSQCFSHFSNGPSSPCLANSSCSNCMRFRRNPWL